METELSKSTKRVETELNKHKIKFKIVELKESTKTSKDAALAINCEVAKIAKTIIFSTKETQKAICVIASGINRINETVIETIIKEKIEKATPEFVLKQTGFVIGGVPPICHSNKLLIFIDKDILNFDDVWTAAGTPHSIFKISSKDLIEITNGKIIDIH